MDSEPILKTLHDRLQLQRYANNTIKSYCGYAQIFLEYMDKYHTLNEVPISEIEAFINAKVFKDNISASYQRSLVGAIKKVYELVNTQTIELNYLYPKLKSTQLPTFFSQEEIRKILNATENLKHKAILTTTYSCGIDIQIVQELLGHSDIRTTMIYIHITDVDKKSTPSPLDFL